VPGGLLHSPAHYVALHQRHVLIGRCVGIPAQFNVVPPAGNCWQARLIPHIAQSGIRLRMAVQARFRSPAPSKLLLDGVEAARLFQQHRRAGAAGAGSGGGSSDDRAAGTGDQITEPPQGTEKPQQTGSGGLSRASSSSIATGRRSSRPVRPFGDPDREGIKSTGQSHPTELAAPIRVALTNGAEGDGQQYLAGCP